MRAVRFDFIRIFARIFSTRASRDERSARERFPRVMETRLVRLISGDVGRRVYVRGVKYSSEKRKERITHRDNFISRNRERFHQQFH